MPLDTKRLPVPDESFSPLQFAKEAKKGIELINKRSCRSDGRKVDQVRPMFLKAGMVSQAKGSAYLEMDQTKVICAVYGPREVIKREDFSLQGQLHCEVKFATFSCQQRRQHQSDSEEHELSVVLRQALEPAVQLEKFPKARMDVFVNVLQNDGSALAGAITAASVALADAGVEMYDLVVGCCMRQKGDTCVLDPCSSEEYSLKAAEQNSNDGNITVGLMPSLHQVAAFVQTGHMSEEAVAQGMRSCISGCQRIYPVLQETLVNAVQEKSTPDQNR